MIRLRGYAHCSQAIRAGRDCTQSEGDGREGGNGPGDHQGPVRERCAYYHAPDGCRGTDLQLMGIETSADHSGSECSFTSAIIAVEELARVDPSVAVLVDVHNTLVNTVLRLYGNDEIKNKWLPDLATNKVSRLPWCSRPAKRRLGRSVFLSPMPVPTLSVCRPPQRRTGTRTYSTGARRKCNCSEMHRETADTVRWISNSGEADTFLVSGHTAAGPGHALTPP